VAGASADGILLFLKILDNLPADSIILTESKIDDRLQNLRWVSCSENLINKADAPDLIRPSSYSPYG
jgi:hypothetical protein